MGHLAKGMDAGIGPPRAVDPKRLAGEPVNGFLQCFLHRGAIVLGLPANIGGAIVFNSNLKALGHVSFDPLGS